MEIIGKTLLDNIRTIYTWKDYILVTLDQPCEVWRSRLSLDPNDRYRLWGKQVGSVSLLKLLTESGAGRRWEAERWGILVKGWVGSALESRADTGDFNWNKKFVSFLKNTRRKKQHEKNRKNVTSADQPESVTTRRRWNCVATRREKIRVLIQQVPARLDRLVLRRGVIHHSHRRKQEYKEN